MNKSEFINSLSINLGNISQEDKAEILEDYEEHFSVGLEEGKTEEEIAQLLGDPKTIAKQFKAECVFRQAEEKASAENIFKAVFAALGLGILNIIFVLGPFVGVLGVLVGLYGASIGITLGGVGLLVGTVLYIFPFFQGVINIPHPVVSIFLSTGFISVGLLFFIGNVYLTKFLYSLTIKYLKFNLKIIKKSEVSA